MPKQKDLKRIVRSRMKKTGESYTTARLQLTRKTQPPVDYAALAGRSDAVIQKQTGRNWAEWVKVLDAAGAVKMPHREIAAYAASLGTADWWSQTVAVGYERIRGLREIGQRRDGSYEANKSRTFAVPVAELFDAVVRWVNQQKISVRTATRPKSMRLSWDEGQIVMLGFMPKGAKKSAVAVQHTKLPSKAAAEKMKAFWGERLADIGKLL